MKIFKSIAGISLVVVYGRQGALAQSNRSDLTCDSSAYSSICDCSYYKSVGCVKPSYGYKYGNGEGASYKQKDQSWDADCAACCCIDPEERVVPSAPAPVPAPVPEPTPRVVPTPLTPSQYPTGGWWTPTWHGPSGWGSPSPSGGGGGAGGGGGGGGGGSHSHPKPKPKPKPHPHKPKPKPKPHPHKPSGGSSGGGGGGGGGGSSYYPSPSSWSAPSAWGAPSGCSSNDPNCWSVKEGSPVAPASSPTFSPTRGIPTKSDPQTSPPVPAPTKPTPYGYKYGNGEGNSYKQKGSYASMLSASGEGMRTNVLFIGLGFVITGLVGFAAGMILVRRRREANNGGIEMNEAFRNSEDTAYTMS